jgi:hypothetical protein
VLAAMTRGAITSDEACMLAWETVAAAYVLEDRPTSSWPPYGS